MNAGGHENCAMAATSSAFQIALLPWSTTGSLLSGVLSVSKRPATEEKHVKSDEEIMEILEAFDGPAVPVTPAGWPTARRTPWPTGPEPPAPCSHQAAGAVDRPVPGQGRGLGETCKAKVRADIAHDKLVVLRYLGSERATRRAVASAYETYRQRGSPG
ncbi:MAG: hypothetical protein LC808_27155 [Actinobacteria bacterium]|nr:hypothetical protein [Actinomycetota bacterium]